MPYLLILVPAQRIDEKMQKQKVGMAYTRSRVLLSASENSNVSIPSPVYQCMKAWRLYIAVNYTRKSSLDQHGKTNWNSKPDSGYG